MSAFGAASLGLRVVSDNPDDAACSPLERMLQLVCWCFEQQEVPSAREIQMRFQCSRATAFRLRAALVSRGVAP